MVLYLRTNNATLYDTEVFMRDGYFDVTGTVYIRNYSKFLFERLDLSTNEVIETFEMLSEIRGQFFEGYYPDNRECTQQDIVKWLMTILEPISEEYGLRIITG